MSYAPDGRLLSPGEVYEAAPAPVRDEEWQEDLNVALICPDCKENPPNLVEEFSAGDTICGSCGRVLADRIIDTRSEWRTFSNDDQGNDDPSRIGDAANPLLHGSQLQTEIGFGDGGMRVRDLSRAHNKSNHDKVNKALQAAYGQISALCDSSNISRPTAETAKMLYKMTDDAKLFKGKSQDAIIAGCIFIACRKHDQQRSFREIFKMTNVSKKEVGRTFKVLEAFIQKSQNSGPSVAGNGAVIDTVNLLNQKGGTTATSAASLMPRACAKLALGTQVQMVAEECADQVAHYGVAAGRSPLSIAGACLYLVSHLMGQPKSPKEIGLAVEVSDGTIRTAYKLMHSEQKKIIKPEWLVKGGDLSKIPAA
ncbi:transcription initiation factor-like protein iib [Decorospora gaudefroyi]|uniref:Transcription initiation factor IIB n=1 Tax=Decorospora gaudefroyi TaxID=184978 RepID=A0A6A5KR98_9PLEO|nr:transcription initiation factor-like protein iib [Decorospora gaudefroyi]